MRTSFFEQMAGSAGNDAGNSSTVHLDARISAAQLPPPPFKGLVKGAAEGFFAVLT